MLDTSGSIGKTTFTRMVSNLSRLLPLFCGNTKIAVMTFGSHIYHEFCFKCSANDKGQIQEAIKNISYHGGWTHTGEAIRCACNNILTIPCGLPRRKNYRKCPAPIDVVIITDGKSNGPLNTCYEAGCFHNQTFYDISTFSIGIGYKYNITELMCLEDVRGDDATHNVFDIDDFDQLEELFYHIVDYLKTPDPLNSSSNQNKYRVCYNANDHLQPKS